MEDIAEYSMSYFDTAKNKGKHAPENFYHGLVLTDRIHAQRIPHCIQPGERGSNVMVTMHHPLTKQKMPKILNSAKF